MVGAIILVSVSVYVYGVHRIIKSSLFREWMFLYVLVEDIKNRLNLFNNTHVFEPNGSGSVSQNSATIRWGRRRVSPKYSVQKRECCWTVSIYFWCLHHLLWCHDIHQESNLWTVTHTTGTRHNVCQILHVCFGEASSRAT